MLIQSIVFGVCHKYTEMFFNNNIRQRISIVLFKKDSLSLKPGESYWESREASMDARSGGESRCDSGKYRDEDVQDFTPE